MSLSPSQCLVTTDWLEQHLSDPDLRLLDASWHMPAEGRDARAEFTSQHIPGAQFFDTDGIADQTIPLPHMVPSEAQFAGQVAALGVGNDNCVVVYDNSGVLSAARARWLLRAMGVPRVAVLDGGLQKWLAEGRPVATTPRAPEPGRLSARLDHARVRTADQVWQSLGEPDVQVVDARAPGRFEGTVPEPRPGLRSGHIPGSRNVCFKEVLNPDGTLKSPDELRQVFEAAGVDLTRPIITSCGSGITASVLALALELLGHDDVSVYDGSWSEWGQRDDLPVETGKAG